MLSFQVVDAAANTFIHSDLSLAFQPLSALQAVCNGSRKLKGGREVPVFLFQQK